MLFIFIAQNTNSNGTLWDGKWNHLVDSFKLVMYWLTPWCSSKCPPNEISSHTVDYNNTYFHTEVLQQYKFTYQIHTWICVIDEGR